MDASDLHTKRRVKCSRQTVEVAVNGGKHGNESNNSEI